MENKNENWHYIELNEQGDEAIKGPFTLDALRSLYESGTINEFTFLWSEGTVSWTPLKNLSILTDISASNINR